MFSQSNVQLIRAKGLEFDIALRKNKDGSFLALLMLCTHAENSLNFTGSGFTCPLHGSAFDPDGKVVIGPAERPLKSFRTEVLGDFVVIFV
jgi:Rieske Fe-S protein